MRLNGKRGGWGAMLKRVALSGLVLGSVWAHASEFSVGRVEVNFAEAGWKEVPLPDSERAYRGDRDGALPVQSKLFIQNVPGRDAQVLLLVSGTSGGLGGGYMSYSPVCESDEHEYREGNSGVRRPFAQCLSVLPLYSSESVFKALAPSLLKLPAVPVSRPLYSIISRHAISTGVFLDVRVFVTEPIAVTGNPLTDTLPDGVPPEHVAWGRQLKEAVKSSVYSISGRLDVPPLRLAVPPPKPQSVALGG